jgi:flagellin
MASFSVVSNIASANAQANLLTSQAGLNKALSRLSSGFRINMSGDDAAGLAVANSYRSDVAVITQGIRNANDGLSDLQIKDSAMNNISILIDRLATLASQAASSSTRASARTTLNAEFADVLAEITRESNVAGLAAQTDFSVYVSNSGTDGVVSGTIDAVTTTTLGINASVLTDATTSAAAVTALAAAVTTLGSAQGKVGALQNSVQFAVTLAQAQVVNGKAADSRIRDANIAEEAANMTRYNILQQSGIAALAQANNASSSVLALLR